MYGRKVKLRFSFVFIILFICSLSVFLILKSLEENVVYFQSPTEVKILAEIDKKKIRIGGMVKKNSILMREKEVKFIVTDFKNEINVVYSGLIPNLFAEKIAFVAETYCPGRLSEDLRKHKSLPDLKGAYSRASRLHRQTAIEMPAARKLSATFELCAFCSLSCSEAISRSRPIIS